MYLFQGFVCIRNNYNRSIIIPSGFSVIVPLGSSRLCRRKSIVYLHLGYYYNSVVAL